MTTMETAAPRCGVGLPTSRRFYVHERSFGSLLAAQPGFRRDLTRALALAAGSRAIEQYVEDADLFGHHIDASVVHVARRLHREAATALEMAFQCLVHVVPSQYGAIAPLLGEHDEINAWCYEAGYFTYATDEDAAKVMYAETGSLHELRGRIRRTPEFDPSLQMISGGNLFLFDRNGHSVSWYRKQHRTQLRRPEAAGAELGFEADEAAKEFACLLVDVTDQQATVDLMGRCTRAVTMTLETLRRSRPSS